MKKALIVSTVSRQFYLFEKANIQALREVGYIVDGAAFIESNDRLNSLHINLHHLEIRRSPLSIRNIHALRQLIKLVKKERYDLIHCHSPVGGVLGRLTGFFCRVDRVIYTAHGFHFYKGSDWRSWLVFYPVELLLSVITDCLILINDEDYVAAKRLYAKQFVKVNGVGLDLDRFLIKSDYSNSAKFKIIMIGEHIERKNYRFALEALRDFDLPFELRICGTGALLEENQDLAYRLGIKDSTRFLGFRDDIPELLSHSDLLISTSSQEGLPVSIMEAMATGLPFLCSDIRGHQDLASYGGGFLYNDKHDFLNNLRQLCIDANLRKSMGEINRKAITDYSKQKVVGQMREIYK